jgi:hypothetical protein
MGAAGYIPFAVWFPSAVAGGLLGVITYRSAVHAATTFGDLVRSVCDLYRRDLLIKIGLAPPDNPDDEFSLWQALGKFIYRGGVDSEEEGLLRYTAPAQQDSADGGDAA